MQKLSTETGVKNIPSVFSFFIGMLIIANLWGCGDFMHPVESTPAPTEYTYNYWLLERTYLFEEELGKLEPEGDSVQTLYEVLDDPFTRYVAPSKSEQTSISINTSIVPGSLGMEYVLYANQPYPLRIKRVYPNGPAGRAGIRRWGYITEVNGKSLLQTETFSYSAAYNTYDSILNYNKSIELKVAYEDDTLSYKMEKEDVYAPTVFVDTTIDGTIVVTITEFKQTTADKEKGSYGELKAYLDSTRNYSKPRILDLRNNPGGHVTQCVNMADLFIKSGPISTRSWRTFNGDGTPVKKSNTSNAISGDAGEEGKFLALVNGGSASCAEIFTAAIAEGAGIPVAGDTTYGKGIGQTTWNTMAGGLAIITNLEFLTPKGNSYHKIGIIPDYPCQSVDLNCGMKALEKYYGKKFSDPEDDKVSKKAISPSKPSIGGAFIESEEPFLIF